MANQAEPTVASTVDANEETKYSKGPFATVTLLFFFWGFITVMNDILIPFLKESFTLSYFQAGLVQFAFFGAFFVVSLLYFIYSISNGDPINRIGYKKTIILALIICGSGCALFSPAAGSQSYSFFLAALFILATGVTLLQIAANPYAAILGKPENASARLNLAQGFNSMGTTLAPIAGGILLYKVFATEGEVTLDAIKTPYLIYGGMFLLLAILVSFSHLPMIQTEDEKKESAGKSALKFPQLKLGMGAIFFYVGAEVAIGSYLVSFIRDENVLNCDETTASIYLALYWGGAMIGRLCGAIAMDANKSFNDKFIQAGTTAVVLLGVLYLFTSISVEDGSLVTNFLPLKDVWPFCLMTCICLASFVFSRGNPSLVLATFSVVLALFLLLSGFATGSVALWTAVGAGLFNSIMWSNIFTLSIKGLGSATSQGSSLLVMMIVGGALFPPAMGYIADLVGIRTAFLFPIISYLYIGYFGLWNYRQETAVVENE